MKNSPFSAPGFLVTCALAITPFWPSPAVASTTPPGITLPEIEIVATIKPVHSLVESILGDEGTATLLISGGASPHTFSLKPSHARALARADLVVWVGPDLERFLEEPLENVAANARHLAVSESKGLTKWPARTGGVWHHQHQEDTHDETGQDGAEHDDAHHDEHEETGHQDASDNAHLTTDPHIWLDPINAIAMSREIEAALIQLYPERAERFAANAAHLRTELNTLDAALRRQTNPVKDRPFFVFHDAYQYFERRYNLSPLGAITVTPDLSPGAKRIQDLRDTGENRGHTCVFAEPQFEPRTMQLLAEGRNATLAYLDPLGSQIDAGPGHYVATLTALADSLVTCLQTKSAE